MNLKKTLAGAGIVVAAIAGVIGLSDKDLEGEVLFSNEFIEYEYEVDKDGEFILDEDEKRIVKEAREMVNYAYVSDEDAPALDNEIISKRTNNIVIRDLGKNAEGNELRSAQSGHNFYKKDGEWKKVKFAKTEKKNIKTSWLNEFIAWAADTGATSPGTMADDDTFGAYSWANPDNAKTADSNYAVASPPGFGTILYTHYLKATNFGFSIPAGSTIDGILTEFEELDASPYNNAYEHFTKIVKADGSYGSENKSTPGLSVALPTTKTYISYGGSADLWSETWAASDINDSDFGVGVSTEYSEDEETGDIRVYHIRITVYYTAVAASDDSNFFGVNF